ncbi:hypothetical protein [Patulibacter minatonensis]|uniref:hypothetical protein n=1 Tax=Patulibacter minatonensis TaxID=298163 RepID=UPI00047E9BDB|nr:hypothetical protein [Patulibacter minatonensis]
MTDDWFDPNAFRPRRLVAVHDPHHAAAVHRPHPRFLPPPTDLEARYLASLDPAQAARDLDDLVDTYVAEHTQTHQEAA